MNVACNPARSAEIADTYIQALDYLYALRQSQVGNLTQVLFRS